MNKDMKKDELLVKIKNISNDLNELKCILADAFNSFPVSGYKKEMESIPLLERDRCRMTSFNKFLESDYKDAKSKYMDILKKVHCYFRYSIDSEKKPHKKAIREENFLRGLTWLNQMVIKESDKNIMGNATVKEPFYQRWMTLFSESDFVAKDEYSCVQKICNKIEGANKTEPNPARKSLHDILRNNELNGLADPSDEELRVLLEDWDYRENQLINDQSSVRIAEENPEKRKNIHSEFKSLVEDVRNGEEVVSSLREFAKENFLQKDKFWKQEYIKYLCDKGEWNTALEYSKNEEKIYKNVLELQTFSGLGTPVSLTGQNDENEEFEIKDENSSIDFMYDKSVFQSWLENQSDLKKYIFKNRIIENRKGKVFLQEDYEVTPEFMSYRTGKFELDCGEFVFKPKYNSKTSKDGILKFYSNFPNISNHTKDVEIRYSSKDEKIKMNEDMMLDKEPPEEISELFEAVSSFSDLFKDEDYKTYEGVFNNLFSLKSKEIECRDIFFTQKLLDQIEERLGNSEDRYYITKDYIEKINRKRETLYLCKMPDFAELAEQRRFNFYFEEEKTKNYIYSIKFLSQFANNQIIKDIKKTNIFIESLEEKQCFPMDEIIEFNIKKDKSIEIRYKPLEEVADLKKELGYNE